MKRITSLFLLSIAMGGTLFAKQVNEQTAVTVANNFIASKMSIAKGEGVKLLTTHTVQASDGSNLNTYYIFDVNNKHGFVVVSGDDIVKPILAYSTTHEFQVGNDVSPETSYWMDIYSKQIAFAVNNDIKATSAVTADWAFYTTTDGGSTANKPTNAVAPLLTTTWNQGTYYDIYTPGTGGGKTPVGCVATAMAQIMKYWNAPTTGTGSYSYNLSPYGTLSADFGATTYQWGLMPNSLGAASSQAAKNAVSLLGYHCAIAVKMNFAPGGSGSMVLAWNANAKCAENAFKNNFGYKPTIDGVYREDYNDAQWDALLKTELDNERPILYAGYGTGGHAFVFDGYDENDMFHINWGWAGLGNGYYTVDNLVPSGVGIGGGGGNFNDDQQALIKIEPAQPGDTMNMKLNSVVSVSASSIQKGTPFTVTAGVSNQSTLDFGGIFTAGIYRADSTFVGYVQYISNQTLAGGQDSTYTFATNGVNAMVAGEYFIKVLYRPEGGAAWLILPGDPHVNKAFITVTDTTVVPTGINDLELEKSFTVYPNPANNKISVSMKNFSGKISALQLINISGQKIKSIENTNTSLVDIKVNDLAEGVYYLRINTDQGIVNKKIVIQR